jgi:hypothetical protein
MQEQNFKNHKQIVYGYYFQTGIPILVLIGIGIYKMTNNDQSDNQTGVIILLTGWILLTMLFRSRGFALKAQDRAIRAEESLRHFILTGKPIDPQLTLSQIIALRFASDEELPALAKKTVAENMRNTEIKKAIKRWRADHHRV